MLKTTVAHACAHCGQPMVARSNERPSHFARRKYCKHSCSVEAIRGSGISLRNVKVEGIADRFIPPHKQRANDIIKRAKVGEIVKRILAARRP